MSSAARGAPGHATCPCCKVRLRPPDSRSFKTRHFPGKTTEVADVSVSRGTRPPATGGRAPTTRGVPPVAPRARTRRRARNRGDLRRRPPPRLPPAKSLTARPSIRNARIVLLSSSHGIASSTFCVCFLSLQTYCTRVDSTTRPIRRAEPRPADGVRAVHRDRAPRAAVDARAAPRRARARARGPGERAETRRNDAKKKDHRSRNQTRAFGAATVATRRAP